MKGRMRMWKRILCLGAVLTAVGLILLRPPEPQDTLPGARSPQRTLLRVWTVGSIGGGQAWLQKALAAYEKRNPGVMTYLRSVQAEEWDKEGAVRPDLVLYLPGDFLDGDDFQPLSHALPVAEPLLRCGRWRGEQVGLPVCWAAYALAVSAQAEPENAATPAPTTLFGRSQQTPDPAPTQMPPYPYEAVSGAAEPLQCARGAGLFTLGMLVERAKIPSLPDAFATLDQTQVYARFASGGCMSAVLTTGQATALDGRILSGECTPCRYMVPEEIVTDQVWLASICRDAQAETADLLAWLVSEDAQRLLSAQSLQPSITTLKLYATGLPGQIQRAAAHGLTAVNAYGNRESVAQAAYQFFQGSITLNDALLPLL